MTHSIRDAIREIRERADAATEGPWEPFKWKDGSQDNSPLINVAAPAIESAIITDIPIDDAVFVAFARTDIPRLCAIVEKLVGALEYFSNAKRRTVKTHNPDGTIEMRLMIEADSEKADEALESAAKILGA